MSDILFEQGDDLVPVIAEYLKLASGKASESTQNHNWVDILAFLQAEIIDPVSDVLVDVMELGQWNMETSATKVIQPGIDFDETRPINDVAVVIFDDSFPNRNVYSFDYVGNNAEGQMIYNGGASGEVVLTRRIGGLFDNSNFSLIAVGPLIINRGYLVIKYQETG